MGAHKNQLIRVCLIDSAIRTLFKPCKETIRLHVCHGLSLQDDGISTSTIEKDIFYMRMEMDAPIKHNKVKGLYFYEEDYNFVHAFLRYWAGYIILPHDISDIIYTE